VLMADNQALLETLLSDGKAPPQVDVKYWFNAQNDGRAASVGTPTKAKARTNKHKSGGGRRKVEAQLRENFQRRLEEAMTIAEVEKRLAIEQAHKEAAAQAEVERNRAFQEILINMEATKKRFMDSVTSEYANREAAAVEKAVQQTKAGLEAQYTAAKTVAISEAVAELEECHSQTLVAEREAFAREVKDLEEKLKTESAAVVRKELEDQLVQAQEQAKEERLRAVQEAETASREAAQAEIDKTVSSVLEASEAERQKAVEDALSRAEADKQQAVALVQTSAAAERDAAVQAMRMSKEQEAAVALEALRVDLAKERQTLETAAKEELEALRVTWEAKLKSSQEVAEAAKQEARQEMEQARELALETLRKETEEKVAVAQEETENFKALFYAEAAARKSIHNRLIELQGNIRVFCRVRPVLQVEEESGAGQKVVEFPGEDMITVTAAKGSARADGGGSGGALMTQRFEFDRTFAPGTSQENVFAAVEPLIVSVLDGYNVCIFAYGQTGSGKTFTMEGPPEDPGVNRRAITALFLKGQERSEMFATEIRMSMLEIYNEEIKDLLALPDAASDKKLEVRLNERGDGHDIPGLTKHQVTCSEEVDTLISTGSANRTVGKHNMNEHSSRSHLVLTLYTVSTAKKDGAIARAKLHLIDLAGSERVSKTDATGQRLKEAQNINKSLSALGDVIASLGKKASHVPFRNSKLTFLLQDSLTNNSKMQMFVNCSPAEYNASETLCSLNFAKRCRAVELGAAKKNTESAEVARLKKQMKSLQEDLFTMQQGDEDDSYSQAGGDTPPKERPARDYQRKGSRMDLRSKSIGPRSLPRVGSMPSARSRSPATRKGGPPASAKKALEKAEE